MLFGSGGRKAKAGGCKKKKGDNPWTKPKVLQAREFGTEKNRQRQRK